MTNADNSSACPSNWQGFTYINDSIAKDQPESQSLSEFLAAGKSLETGVFALSAARGGDRLRIVALDCGGANSRLMGMGLMPGMELDAISCTASGSVIIALNDRRLGLGADMARCVRVAAIATPSEAQLTPDLSQTKPSMNHQTDTSVRLRDAAIGSRLRVAGYEPTARTYKRKLLAMGLTPGVEFTVTRHAPLGDPTQIEVRGFSLSLRKDEADALQVEPVAVTEGGAL